jgi:hypothetical protein
VFNFGRSGHNMPEHLEVLGQILNTSPDFVLLQLYINDFETAEMERPRPYPLLPEPLHGDLERSSLVYGLLQAQWRRVQDATGIAESYASYMERHLREPDAPQGRRAFGQLREYFQRVGAAGVSAGAVLFPAPDAMGRHGAGYPFGYIHKRVRDICAQEQVPCLDLLSAFASFDDPRSMWVSPFDAHPNAVANQRAAREILQSFRPAWVHRQNSAAP